MWTLLKLANFFCSLLKFDKLPDSASRWPWFMHWYEKTLPSTHRTVIKWRTTDSNGWESRRLWTCCLHIAHTIGAIRTVHIYCWSWRVCRGEACPCVRRVRRCWRTVTLCCGSLIIIHNCWDENKMSRISVFVWQDKLQTTWKKLFACFKGPPSEEFPATDAPTIISQMKSLIRSQT